MADEPLHVLEAGGVRFVRIEWCDNANVIRAKAIHTTMLPHFMRHGVGISAGMMGVPVMFDAVMPDSGLGPVGEVRLIPDWATLTPLPYAPGHARVLGDMVLNDKPWAYCPRDFLKRMIAEAAKAGFEIGAAFENEFYLLRAGLNGIEPVDETIFAQVLAMDISRAVIDDIAESLRAQEIPVEAYYPESGPGQHEMPVRYTTALGAADRQIAFRETVHAVAMRHGLKASFLPKIFADKAGSGCHMHLSLWRGEQNLVADANGSWRLSPLVQSFIAGILANLPALMALTTPSTNSYRRIRPHCWSGAYRCWGLDNRECPVRVPTNPAGPGPSNFELKTSDASANPYLALGAVLAAGLDGVRRRLNLGEPVDVDPGNLSDAERHKRGIAPLPTSLGEAIEQFSSNSVLPAALGMPLAQAYLAVRWAEWQALKDAVLADEVKLLLQRY
ncbi:MAG: glutamine synthetase family protein [Gemmataceae bacterium]|nr:glutamine synthetase family protein [Gemmataceae bacterium]